MDGSHQFGKKSLKLDWKLFNSFSKTIIPFNQQESLLWDESLNNYVLEAPTFDSTDVYNTYFYLTSAIQKESNKGLKTEFSIPFKKHKLQIGTFISSLNHNFNSIEGG